MYFFIYHEVKSSSSKLNVPQEQHAADMVVDYGDCLGCIIFERCSQVPKLYRSIAGVCHLKKPALKRFYRNVFLSRVHPCVMMLSFPVLFAKSVL